jgi:hypothetical protein
MRWFFYLLVNQVLIFWILIPSMAYIPERISLKGNCEIKG